MVGWLAGCKKWRKVRACARGVWCSYEDERLVESATTTTNTTAPLPPPHSPNAYRRTVPYMYSSPMVRTHNCKIQNNVATPAEGWVCVGNPTPRSLSIYLSIHQSSPQHHLAHSIRKPHSLRHNGHCWGAAFCDSSHLTMQCRWKAWLHVPHAAVALRRSSVHRRHVVG